MENLSKAAFGPGRDKGNSKTVLVFFKWKGTYTKCGLLTEGFDSFYNVCIICRILKMCSNDL